MEQLLVTVRRSVVVRTLALQTNVAGGPGERSTLNASTVVRLVIKLANLTPTDLSPCCPVNVWNVVICFCEQLRPGLLERQVTWWRFNDDKRLSMAFTACELLTDSDGIQPPGLGFLVSIVCIFRPPNNLGCRLLVCKLMRTMLLMCPCDV